MKFKISDRHKLSDVTPQEIENAFIDYMGEANQYEPSFYIFPDGKTVHGQTHWDIRRYIIDCTPFLEEGSEESDYPLEICNCVRGCAVSCENYIELPEFQLTSDQYDTLTDHLDDNRSHFGSILIMRYTRNGLQEQRYDYDQYTTDDIVKKIKRLYASGTLYEGLSTEVDNQGNELSPEQAQFFEHSKMRNSDGNLLVCYHGTKNLFNTFDINKSDTAYFGKGIYLTTYLKYAQAYGDVGKYYINAQNPYHIDFNGFTYDAYQTKKREEFVKLVNLYLQNGGNLKKVQNATDSWIAKVCDLAWDEMCYEAFDPVQLSNIMWGCGYDCLFSDFGYDDYTDIVVYDPSIIKSIENKTPTNSSNFNESVTPITAGRRHSNAYATYSLSDVKTILKNNPMIYRLLYDDREKIYLMGNGEELIHYDLIESAMQKGLYDDQWDFIEDVGGIYNYIDCGIDGKYEEEMLEGDDWKYGDIVPFLYYIQIIPKSEYDEETIDSMIMSASSDDYNQLYDFETAVVLTRDCDLEETPLYQIFGTLKKKYTGALFGF